MSPTPSFKTLFRMNLSVTLVVCSLTFILLSITMSSDTFKALTVSGMGAIIILLIGIADFYILGPVLFETRYSRLKKSQKRTRYILSYIISPFIYAAIWTLFSPLMHEYAFMWLQMPFLAVVIISSWSMNTLIFMLYNYSFLQHTKVQSEIENLQLKAIVSETANQLLKQQIHPHFLFNVLNTVKLLYKQDLAQGEAYLVHLANFLRASISDHGAKIVKLEDELNLCLDYIEMQRIRFGKALTYQTYLPAEIVEQKFVPYFSLQSLLENAIKHNEFTEESPLDLIILVEGDFIKVMNNWQPRQFKEPSTGLGLANLAERYRLLSGDEVIITQGESYFEVKIKLLDK